MRLEWIDFYSEFATKLLAYENDQQSLIEKIRASFAAANQKMPKLDSDNNLTDIDPFTVFGLFNKHITDVNRVAILEGIAKVFSIKAAVPESFDGVPVLNNLRATFYGFKEDRGEKDIGHIWRLFKAAIPFM